MDVLQCACDDTQSLVIVTYHAVVHETVIFVKSWQPVTRARNQVKQLREAVKKIDHLRNG